MVFGHLDTFKLAFKVACLITTAGMIVYWIDKYLKDEDISVVEYKLVKDLKPIFQPEFTICFEDPLLEERLNQINSTISAQKYLQYLTGKIQGDAIYRSIEYDNVTIQLSEYVDLFTLNGNFEDGKEYKNCRNMNKCPYGTIRNNINIFIKSQIYKCFGIKPEEVYVSGASGINIIFDRKLRKILPKLGTVYMGFNFPQQRLLDYPVSQYWNHLDKTGYYEWFKVTTVELLKRRNRRSEPCSIEWKELDDWILKRHIQDIGCRAPYIKAYEDFPICDTKTKMEQSVFSWANDPGSTYPIPCEGASNIGYTFSSMAFSTLNISRMDPSSLILYVSYTSKMKTITQSRLIDGHALVGYIGGYVGLLLGTIQQVVTSGVDRKSV